MIKAIAILSLAAVASAGVIAPAYTTYSHAPVATYAHAPAVVAHAAPLAYAAPAYQYAPVVKAVKAVAVQPEPFDAHPQYNYGYSVSDALTGDQHSAHESRDGDVVTGQYSLVEPDGSVRTVTYTADAIHGFNAQVDRSAPAVAVVKKAVVAAPAYQYAPIAKVAVAHPVAYAHAPVATYAHAPVATYAHAPVVAKAVVAAPAYAHYAAPATVYHH